MNFLDFVCKHFDWSLNDSSKNDAITNLWIFRNKLTKQQFSAVVEFIGGNQDYSKICGNGLDETSVNM